MSTYNYRQHMKLASSQAAAGSGLSERLFESRLQAAYKKILGEAPAELKSEVEAELLEQGFDPNYVPEPVSAGECDLTGIDNNCCPCGYHP